MTIRKSLQPINIIYCIILVQLDMPNQSFDGVEMYSIRRKDTDDLLVLLDRAEEILRDEIGSGERSFELKPDSIGPPSQYLGGKLTLRELPSGIKAWGYSSGQYVKKAVSNVKKYLKTIGRKLPSKAETPTSVDYRPEIDVSPELNDLDGSNWNVALDR